MPSRFPGMDPYIEGQIWQDFHLGIISAIREIIVPQIVPRYVARIQERVYIEYLPDALPDITYPAMVVLEKEGMEQSAERSTVRTDASAPEVVEMLLPMPERVRHVFLTIRARESMEVITVLEVLSPGNKRSGSDGRREYLSKREAVLQSAVHLVELDLLRGGERLPVLGTLPLGDYYAFVCRANRRPRATVFSRTLRQRLPIIPIPLSGGDSDVSLDLQAAFDTVYDRVGYDYSLDYGQAVHPPLSEADAIWARELLASATPPPQA